MEASPALASAERQKALGAFYTPAPMAEKMVQWAVRAPTDRTLDPSFGGLVFLEAAKARLRHLGAGAAEAAEQLYGVDLDEDAHVAALAHASLRLRSDALLSRDFFEVVPGEDLPLAQAVVGNPPYVRYQGWNSTNTAAHTVAQAAGVPLTRLASSWAPFVIHSTAFVADGGRLALVLPAEMLHAQYAGEVLTFVERRFARTALALFEKRVFPGALEEVVLLFAEGRNEGQSQAQIVECDTLADLDVEVLQARLTTPTFARSQAENKPPPATSPQRGKILAQLLPQPTRELYERFQSGSYAHVTTLGALGSVDIGAVTGANDYFLLAEGDEPRIAEELLRPAVSKAVHVRGARFGNGDFAELVEAGVRCRLFVADESAPEDRLATTSGYLRRGRKRRVHKRYKCRVRDPWWSVPLPKHGVPTLFLTYCASEHPRLVINEAGALHTNTVHGVTMVSEVKAAALAASFYNSLTLLSAELVGRSYGGGVLKLEPTEAEALLLPLVPEEAAEHLGTVDRWLRARELGAVLDLMDRLLLVQGLGLSETEVESLRAGAERLRGRRRSRGKAPV